LFGSDLDELLADSLDEPPSTSEKANSASEFEADWDTINIVPEVTPTKSKATTAAATPAATSAARNVSGTTQLIPRPLPKLSTLSRPEVLFPTLLPALIMVHGGRTELYIEGTHPPTLELIADYFTNHARKDLQGGGHVSISTSAKKFPGGSNNLTAMFPREEGSM